MGKKDAGEAGQSLLRRQVDGFQSSDAGLALGKRKEHQLGPMEFDF